MTEQLKAVMWVESREQVTWGRGRRNGCASPKIFLIFVNGNGAM